MFSKLLSRDVSIAAVSSIYCSDLVAFSGHVATFRDSLRIESLHFKKNCVIAVFRLVYVSSHTNVNIFLVHSKGNSSSDTLGHLFFTSLLMQLI